METTSIGGSVPPDGTPTTFNRTDTDNASTSPAVSFNNNASSAHESNDSDKFHPLDNRVTGDNVKGDHAKGSMSTENIMSPTTISVVQTFESDELIHGVPTSTLPLVEHSEHALPPSFSLGGHATEHTTDLSSGTAAVVEQAAEHPIDLSSGPPSAVEAEQDVILDALKPKNDVMPSVAGSIPAVAVGNAGSEPAPLVYPSRDVRTSIPQQLEGESNKDSAAITPCHIQGQETRSGRSIDTARPTRERKPPSRLSPDEIGPQHLQERSQPVHQPKQEEDKHDSDEEEEEDDSVYCICRKPDTGTPMVRCDGCDEWFHLKCMKLKPKDLKDTEHWVCPTCKEIADGLFSDPKSLYKPKAGRSKATRPAKEKSKRKKVMDTKGKAKSDGTKLSEDSAKEKPLKIKISHPTMSELIKLGSPKRKHDAPTKIPAEKIKAAPQPTVAKVPCERKGCNNMAAPGSTFCGYRCESLHAEDLFNDLLNGTDKSKPASNTTIKEDTVAVDVPITTVTEPQKSAESSQPPVEKAPPAKRESKPAIKKDSGDIIRRTTCSTFKSILSLRKSKHPQINLDTIVRQIEEAMFSHHGSVDQQYKLQLKRLASNMRKNSDLIDRLCTGELTPEDLVQMTPEELGNADYQKARKRAEEKMMRMVEVAPTTIKIVLNNDKDADRVVDLGIEGKNVENRKVAALKIEENVPMNEAEELQVEHEGSKDEDHMETMEEPLNTGAAEVKPLARYKVDTSTASDKLMSPGRESHTQLGDSDKSVPTSKPERATWQSHPANDSKHRAAWEGTIKNAGHTKIRVKGKFLLGTYDSPPSLAGVVPQAIDVHGRIRPEEVWQYILKMKVSTSKEVVILRVTPYSEDDEVGYVSLFSYFDSRKRCGVLGSKTKTAVKDMYLVPVSARRGLPSEITKSYLKGPGEGTKIKKDMLLAVIVKNLEKKRKRPAEVSLEVDENKVRRTKDVISVADDEAYSPFADFDDAAPAEVNDPDDAPYSPSQDVADSYSYSPKNSNTAPEATAPSAHAADAVSALGLDFGAIQSLLKSMNSGAGKDIDDTTQQTGTRGDQLSANMHARTQPPSGRHGPSESYYQEHPQQSAQPWQRDDGHSRRWSGAEHHGPERHGIPQSNKPLLPMSTGNLHTSPRRAHPGADNYRRYPHQNIHGRPDGYTDNQQRAQNNWQRHGGSQYPY